MTLTPSILLSAYCQGCFPMAEEDGTVYWYDPDPRTIIPLDAFQVSRSLARRLRHGGFTVCYDTAFREVMTRCAEPAPGREQTWISNEFIEVYSRLYEAGFAHSVETWMEDELVGGVYGVSIGGLFAGESMFSRRADASKIALVHLVERLRQKGFSLFDVQFTTSHLQRFGAIEVSRDRYKQLLAQALTLDVRFA
ncbi:MAG: leucyl/phenylalanyl-tRNA--protein transferase [Sedimentisphaerales bacterium]|nr:leucyl/phenylalanyl-tRNA--protein transferase [Sedimentisphaerales bacterium]